MTVKKREEEMSQAGSIIIRPTREDAERDPELFHDLLEWCREHGALPLKEIAAIIGDTTKNPETNIHKKISKQTLSKDARDRCLRHIFEEGDFISRATRRELTGIGDALYFAFLNFAAVKETSQDKARARCVGVYKFWRPSVEYEDEFIFGRIDFEEHPKNYAVKARMLQVKKSADGEGPAHEEFSGYLFRVCHMHLMLLHDAVSNDVRVTIFPHAKISEVGTARNPKSPFKDTILHTVWMDGFVFGIDGSNCFFSPLHLSLVDDADELARLDEQLDIIGKDDRRLPRRVLKKLQHSGPLRRL